MRGTEGGNFDNFMGAVGHDIIKLCTILLGAMQNYTLGKLLLSDIVWRQFLTQDGLKIFINWPEIECHFTQRSIWSLKSNKNFMKLQFKNVCTN